MLLHDKCSKLLIITDSRKLTDVKAYSNVSTNPCWYHIFQFNELKIKCVSSWRGKMYMLNQSIYKLSSCLVHKRLKYFPNLFVAEKRRPTKTPIVANIWQCLGITPVPIDFSVIFNDRKLLILIQFKDKYNIKIHTIKILSKLKTLPKWWWFGTHVNNLEILTKYINWMLSVSEKFWIDRLCFFLNTQVKFGLKKYL